ncbi:MAG: hypothetical protein LBR43_01670 [Spiroplasmataceae bacterium]|jgi:hypothetical protein|nr:hypothetical protein [Spiroplasmataceae bacterium]
MKTRQKKSTKRSIFLWIIIFSHVFPVIFSAFYDKFNHSNHNVELSDPKYWFWAFTWWSAWTSLLTVPWAIYKLLNLKKNKESSFKEQIWDMIVAEANFISGFFFCCGGFLLTISSAGKTQPIYPLLGKIKPIYLWSFYNFFWHILAPGLTLYYFWNYCKSNKLVKRKKTSLIINLFNPTIYLLYVVARPLVLNFLKSKSNLPHHYPHNYPYPPFFWIAGQFANGEEARSGKSKLLFLSWKPTWISGLIWLVLAVALWYAFFTWLFNFFVKIKRKQNNSEVKF